MKYMLLIHQGTTPTPMDPDAWAKLSQEEQNAWVERVHRAGIQVNCHANGDVAIDMYLTAAAQNGIIALDFCKYNDDERRMSRVIRAMLHRLSGNVRASCMDQQSFWLYEFGEAA